MDLKQIQHIANLARLEFTEDELKVFLDQFNEILDYMEKLKEVDTTNVTPMTHAVEISCRSRDDSCQSSENVELILANAPDHEGPFFKVPKIIKR